MASVQTVINKIEEQQKGAQEVGVLVVEGKDDVHAVTCFLNNAQFNGWRQKWLIAEAGNKKLVLEVLEQKTGWLGFVDPDEWDRDKIAQVEQELPNIWFLPRFCIENYLVSPEEIYAALPTNMQNKIEQQRTDGEANGVAVIANRTQRELNKWVAHGVLWSVVNPLWSGLRALGFKEQLLKDPDIALNEAAITATLTQWHQHLDATRLYQQFESELERVRALPEQQQLQRWVHGKSFFNQVVNPVLNDLIGQQGADQRQTLLFRSYASPVDFEPFWQKMGLLSS